MLEASLSNLPTVLIEPNAVPGFTNRVLAPVIRAAAVGFEEAARFYGSRASVTGLPVRKEFGNIAPKQHIPPYTVLVSGGSQGSTAINGCLMQMLPLLAAVEVPLQFVHQTGEHDLDRVRAAYSEQGVKAETTAFIEDMPRAFAEADLIIARSGALTVGEIAASGKAALLIPFPAATDQHQLENARVLERAGGARVIEQAKLTPQALLKEMTDILLRPGRLREMLTRPSWVIPVATAPSGRMSCSQTIQGIRRRRVLAIAGSNAGNDGDTDTKTSTRSTAGSTAV